MNKACHDLETAKIRERNFKQNLQNAVNVIDITEDTDPLLKSVYDLSVKLLESD